MASEHYASAGWAGWAGLDGLGWWCGGLNGFRVL